MQRKRKEEEERVRGREGEGGRREAVEATGKRGGFTKRRGEGEGAKWRSFCFDG